MILGELLRIPDRQFMPHGLLGDLVFRQRLYHLVVDQETIDIEDLVRSTVGGLEDHRLAAFGVLHPRQDRAFYQLRFVLQFLHGGDR